MQVAASPSQGAWSFVAVESNGDLPIFADTTCFATETLRRHRCCFCDRCESCARGSSASQSTRSCSPSRSGVHTIPVEILVCPSENVESDNSGHLPGGHGDSRPTVRGSAHSTTYAKTPSPRRQQKLESAVCLDRRRREFSSTRRRVSPSANNLGSRPSRTGSSRTAAWPWARGSRSRSRRRRPGAARRAPCRPRGAT